VGVRRFSDNATPMMIMFVVIMNRRLIIEGSLYLKLLKVRISIKIVAVIIVSFNFFVHFWISSSHNLVRSRPVGIPSNINPK